MVFTRSPGGISWKLRYSLVPAALFLIGLVVSFFQQRRNEPYPIWACYSLILYHLVIFGLLTVLTPLSPFVKLAIALAIPYWQAFLFCRWSSAEIP